MSGPHECLYKCSIVIRISKYCLKSSSNCVKSLFKKDILRMGVIGNCFVTREEEKFQGY
jgi:hypothetical protein